MPRSWIEAINHYFYPVNLTSYEGALNFPNFFNMRIDGDRTETIAFENRYQALSSDNIEAFFEVVYWKLYSQPNRRQKTTTRIMDHIQNHNITALQLWNAIQEFIALPSIDNLNTIRQGLGITTTVLAIPLTLVSFASPLTIPMIDTQVARWVNQNYQGHNADRLHQLTPFYMNYTSLRENDFNNYLNWVNWCKEIAQRLTELTNNDWRARDVEMAVFTAERSNLPLNILPGAACKDLEHFFDMNKIYVIGIGYKALDNRAREIVLASEIILASKRLFEVFKGYEEYESVKDKIKVINNVDETISFIKSQISNLKSQIVLLASGDPTFFGIGRRAVREFGKRDG